jgi:type IV pilus assembly protein PilC
VFLVPVFESVYARANTALPAPTRLLIAVSGVIRGYAGGHGERGGCGGAVCRSAQSPRGRRLIDGASACPCSGRSFARRSGAHLRTLSVLLSSGIPLIRRWAPSRVSSSRVIEDALTGRRARDGGTIAGHAEAHGRVPEHGRQFVAGEKSGTLPAMLRAQTLRQQVTTPWRPCRR